MTLLFFIIALGILVIVHEWGHFIVARKSGIRVEKFSIGFGPTLFKIQGKETEFRVALLPLGGYVKLYGEDPEAEAEGDDQKAKEIAASPDSFTGKPARFRLATVLGGPVMNLVLAFVVMPFVFLIGRQVPAILEKPPVILGVMENSPAKAVDLKKGDLIQSINEESFEKWGDVLNWIILHPHQEIKMVVQRDGVEKIIHTTIIDAPDSRQKMGYLGIEPQYFWGNDPIVGDIVANGPASTSGLKTGDFVTSVNDEKISTWTHMTDKIRASDGKPIHLGYLRQGIEGRITITPAYNEDAKAYLIGITRFTNPDLYVVQKYSPGKAITHGFQETLRLGLLTLDVVKRLFSFELSYKTLGGPLQIAEASGQAAKSGLGEFLYFLCFMSLQLGILNLLPIPVLDGGHVLFMAIEGIIRKPLSLKVKMVAMQTGMALLLGLMILITFNDIDRIWGIGELITKAKGLF